MRRRAYIPRSDRRLLQIWGSSVLSPEAPPSAPRLSNPPGIRFEATQRLWGRGEAPEPRGGRRWRRKGTLAAQGPLGAAEAGPRAPTCPGLPGGRAGRPLGPLGLGGLGFLVGKEAPPPGAGVAAGGPAVATWTPHVVGSPPGTRAPGEQSQDRAPADPRGRRSSGRRGRTGTPARGRGGEVAGGEGRRVTYIPWKRTDAESRGRKGGRRRAHQSAQMQMHRKSADAVFLGGLNEKIPKRFL